MVLAIPGRKALLRPHLTWDKLRALPNMALAMRADRGVTADGAAYFTAANKEYLTIAHAAQTGLDLGTTDFSISVWVKRAASGAAQVICGKYQSDTAYWEGHFAANDTLHFDCNMAGLIIQLYTSATFTSTTAFYHVVVTADRDGVGHIYVNGVDQTLGTSVMSASTASNTGAFNVGTDGYSTPTFMNGPIDSLCISTGGRLYTQAEVDWLYNGGKGRIADDINNAADPVAVGLKDSYLKSWWDLGEADGANRADSIGSNTLTPTGATLTTGGAFDAADNTVNWTFGALWSDDTTNDEADAASAVTDLEQTVVGNVQNGKIYAITYTLRNYVSGNVTPKIGGTAGTARSSNITVTAEEITGGSTNELVEFTGGTLVGSITNVTVISKGPSRVAGIQSTFQIDSDGDGVGNWLDQTANARLFAQSTISKRPLWKANIWGTNPGILFDGVDDLLLVASAFLTGTKGAVIALVRLVSVGDAYQTIFASCDQASTDDRMQLMERIENAFGNKMMVLVSIAGVANVIDSTTVLATATNYVTGHLSSGVAYSMRVNKIKEVHTVRSGSDNGSWVGNVTPGTLDNVTVGASKHTSEVAFLSGYIGVLFVTTDYPTQRVQEAMENIATLYSNGVRI